MKLICPNSYKCILPGLLLALLPLSLFLLPFEYRQDLFNANPDNSHFFAIIYIQALWLVWLCIVALVVHFRNTKSDEVKYRKVKIALTIFLLLFATTLINGIETRVFKWQFYLVLAALALLSFSKVSQLSNKIKLSYILRYLCYCCLILASCGIALSAFAWPALIFSFAVAALAISPFLTYKLSNLELENENNVVMHTRALSLVVLISILLFPLLSYLNLLPQRYTFILVFFLLAWPLLNNLQKLGKDRIETTALTRISNYSTGITAALFASLCILAMYRM